MFIRNKQKPLVFCLTCGACLGIHRPKFGKEHLKRFPSHTEFLVKKIKDPFDLPNINAYVNRLKESIMEIPQMEKFASPEIQQRKSTPRRFNRTYQFQ